MKHCSFVLAFLLAVFGANLSAQTKIEVQDSTTILSVLQSCSGQTVELRMRSGEKMGGKVEKTTDKIVHLSQLTGAEFYEAFVDVKEISAVVVRAKK